MQPTKKIIIKEGDGKKIKFSLLLKTFAEFEIVFSRKGLLLGKGTFFLEKAFTRLAADSFLCVKFFSLKLKNLLFF